MDFKKCNRIKCEITIFKTAQKIAAAIRKSGIKCEGINLFMADGEAAGQEVWHSHLHILPRSEGDEFGLQLPKDYFVLPKREELDEVAGKICQALK